MKTLIAIDPGASGGIAYQHPGEWVVCMAMPATTGDLVDQLRSIAASAQECVCYLETMVKHTGPNRPASSIIVYGHNCGVIEGALMAFCVRVELIQPKAWQKVFGLSKDSGLSQSKWKNKLKAEAQRLFPVTLGDITLKTADALLLLEYGRRQ